MMGEVEGLIWLFGMPAMPQLKPWSARGITHQPAFMGNSYSHVFSFIHPVDEFSLKEMRAWGQSKILSCCQGKYKIPKAFQAFTSLPTEI